MKPAETLILASSSPYRQELLKRLAIPFRSVSPNLDESALPGESATDLSLRLSEAKARKIAELEPGSTVIGSDQVAVLQGKQLTKPGSHQRARQQLLQMKGQSVYFHTGVCVLHGPDNHLQSDIVSYEVRFRHYNDSEIERYLETEQPFNCAGSFKSEAMGISLIEAMNGPDPTALIGLPLIRLCQMLRVLNYNLP